MQKRERRATVCVQPSEGESVGRTIIEKQLEKQARLRAAADQDAQGDASVAADVDASVAADVDDGSASGGGALKVGSPLGSSSKKEAGVKLAEEPAVAPEANKLETAAAAHAEETDGKLYDDKDDDNRDDDNRDEDEKHDEDPTANSAESSEVDEADLGPSLRRLGDTSPTNTTPLAKEPEQPSSPSTNNNSDSKEVVVAGAQPSGKGSSTLKETSEHKSKLYLSQDLLDSSDEEENKTASKSPTSHSKLQLTMENSDDSDND